MQQDLDMDRRTRDRREEDISVERVKLTWHVVAWILGVMVTCLVTYNATINSVRDVNTATLQRVFVLETKQENADQRLQRMESKIDRLLER